MLQAQIPSFFSTTKLSAKPAWIALRTLSSLCNKLGLQEQASLRGMPEDYMTLPPRQIWWGWRSLLLCSVSEGSGKGIRSYETQLVKTCKKCITSWFYW